MVSVRASTSTLSSAPSGDSAVSAPMSRAPRRTSAIGLAVERAQHDGREQPQLLAVAQRLARLPAVGGERRLEIGAAGIDLLDALDQRAGLAVDLGAQQALALVAQMLRPGEPAQAQQLAADEPDRAGRGGAEQQREAGPEPDRAREQVGHEVVGLDPEQAGQQQAAAAEQQAPPGPRARRRRLRERHQRGRRRLRLDQLEARRVDPRGIQLERRDPVRVAHRAGRRCAVEPRTVNLSARPSVLLVSAVSSSGRR